MKTTRVIYASTISLSFLRVVQGFAFVNYHNNHHARPTMWTSSQQPTKTSLNIMDPGMMIDWTEHASTTLVKFANIVDTMGGGHYHFLPEIHLTGPTHNDALHQVADVTSFLRQALITSKFFVQQQRRLSGNILSMKRGASLLEKTVLSLGDDYSTHHGTIDALHHVGLVLKIGIVAFVGLQQMKNNYNNNRLGRAEHDLFVLSSLL